MQMFQAVTSASQVFWCIYSLALGSSADQDILYKELCVVKKNDHQIC